MRGPCYETSASRRRCLSSPRSLGATSTSGGTTRTCCAPILRVVVRTGSPHSAATARLLGSRTLRGDGAAIGESLALANRPPANRPSPPRSCTPATWTTITAAARSGLQLGVHSATHRSLPVLDELELKHEVVESRAIIRSRTGVTPEFFAYPYGLWNDRIRDAVCTAGYRAAFTLETGRQARTNDPWALPRVSVPARIEDAAFHAWTAGLNPRRGRGTC